MVQVCAGPAALSHSPACTPSVGKSGIAKRGDVEEVEMVETAVEDVIFVMVTVTVLIDFPDVESSTVVFSAAESWVV